MFTAIALRKHGLRHRNTLRWLVAVGVFLAGAFNITRAEIVTDRFVCELGTERRSIELTFLNDVNTLPCEIRETREDGQTRTLWRASYDVSFCQRQIDNHRQKLDALGWPCESAPVDGRTGSRNAAYNNSDRNNSESLSSRALRSWGARGAAGGVNRGAERGARTDQNEDSATDTATDTTTDTSSDTSNAVVTVVSLQVANSDEPTGESTRRTAVSTPLDGASPQVSTPAAALAREVQFMENPDAAELSPSDRPAPPDFLTDPLSPESLQQFDDWLIYLSAQSMASIRQVIGDQETFNEYLVAENLKSDNIYTRLQNRIEFLQSLLEEQ
jgi:hypothetical protein